MSKSPSQIAMSGRNKNAASILRACARMKSPPRHAAFCRPGCARIGVSPSSVVRYIVRTYILVVEARGAMLRAAIVPQHRVAHLPALAEDEARLLREVLQLLDQRAAFVGRQPSMSQAQRPR